MFVNHVGNRMCYIDIHICSGQQIFECWSLLKIIFVTLTTMDIDVRKSIKSIIIIGMMILRIQ